MTIEELLAATGLTANDLVPIWDAEAASNVEPTQKITAAQLAAAVKSLASLPNTTEMNTAIQQSTASVGVGSLITTVSQYCDLRYAKRTGGVVIISLLVKKDTPNGAVLCTFDSSIKPVQNDYVSVLFYGSGQLNTSASVWIESSDTSKATYYGSTATAGAYANIVYGVE